MRLSRIAILALSTLVSACGEPENKLWELSGFMNPESALPDPASGIIYVSNVNGAADGRDGNGYVSKVAIDGKLMAEKWVTGLDAPKGLALFNGKLFVADLDKLVEIDVASGTITTKHEAPGAKILNDVAADSEGRIYVSDWPGNAIWRLADGKFEKWLEGDQLKAPNGLLVESDKLIVAAWGNMAADFSVKVPGNLLTVSLSDKTVADLGDGKPVGTLDGLEPFDAESYIVTDFMAGKVLQISRSGAVKELLVLSPGSADLGFVPSTRTAIVPMMVEGKVVAYRF